MAERTARHEDIDPGIDLKSATHEVTDGYCIHPRNLERQASRAQSMRPGLDMEQQRRKVARIESGNWTGPVSAHESKANAAPVPTIEITVATLQEPAQLLLGAMVVEYFLLDARDLG